MKAILLSFFFLCLFSPFLYSQMDAKIVGYHTLALQSITGGESDEHKFFKNITRISGSKYNHKKIIVESLIKFKEGNKNEAFEKLLKLKFRKIELKWLDSVLFYTQIGQFYGEARDYINAEKNLLKAKKLLKRRKMATTTINAWLIYYHINTEKYNRAINIVKEELKVVKNPLPMLTNMIYIYQTKGDFVNAAIYLEKAKKENQKKENYSTDSWMYLNLYLGNNARAYGKINTAISYYKESISDTVGMKNWYPFIQSNYQLAELYIKKREFDSCEIYLKRFFLCPCLDVETQSWLYQAKADFFKQINRQKDYLANLEVATKLKDSVIRIMQKDYSKISELNNAQIDLIEENLEIKSKNHQLSEQKSRFFMWMVLFLFIALLVLVIYFRSNTKKNREIAEVNQQLALSKIETMKANEEALLHKVKSQNFDLTQLAKNLTMKREFEQQQKQILKELLNTDQKDIQKELRKLYQQANNQENIDNHLHSLQIDIEKINSSFYLKMKEKYPQLSQNDIEICALHLLNLDTKEIASIKNIEPKSIQINRYRIKKKLNLGENEDLIRFLEGHLD